jgi:hypothetical protein
MSFGGSVSAMIASMKANKRSRVSAFDKIKYLKKRNHTAVHFKNNATPKELETLRAKLQRGSKKKSLKNVIFLLVVIALLIYAIGFVEI